MTETKITQKFQTTIPKNIRNFLQIKPGKEVEWHIARGMVIIDVTQKIKNPVEFLRKQIKMNKDAVDLVKEARDEMR